MCQGSFSANLLVTQAWELTDYTKQLVSTWTLLSAVWEADTLQICPNHLHVGKNPTSEQIPSDGMIHFCVIQT